MLAGEAVDFSGWETEDVGGLGAVAARGYDVEMRIIFSQGVGRGLGLGDVLDFETGEGGEFGPIRRDPGDDWEQSLVEEFDGIARKQVGAGAGLEDGIENDGRLDFPAVFYR